MHQRLNLTALLVDEYDTALSFFVQKLGFELREDTVLTDDKRWVVVACSCFSKQTILPVTTSLTRSGASVLSKRLAMNHMARWRSSKTSTETDGI